MKVILLKDIAKVGRKYDVKNMPDGHVMNFLIPRGMVEPATPQSLKRLEKVIAKAEGEREVERAGFEGLLKTLKDTTVEMTVEANDQGHLFKGIKSGDIAVALSEKVGGPVDEKIIVLSAPIKEVGEHSVTLSSGDLEGSFTLVIKTA